MSHIDITWISAYFSSFTIGKPLRSWERYQSGFPTAFSIDLNSDYFCVFLGCRQGLEIPVYYDYSEELGIINKKVEFNINLLII